MKCARSQRGWRGESTHWGSLVPTRSHRMVTACAQTKEIATLFQQGTDAFVCAKQCAADWLCAVVALGPGHQRRQALVCEPEYLAVLQLYILPSQPGGRDSCGRKRTVVVFLVLTTSSKGQQTILRSKDSKSHLQVSHFNSLPLACKSKKKEYPPCPKRILLTPPLVPSPGPTCSDPSL